MLIGAIIFVNLLILASVLYIVSLRELRQVAEDYDAIFDSYTNQYHDFCDEMDKLCDLLNQYHLLLDGYQIPLIQIPNERQRQQYINDDW